MRGLLFVCILFTPVLGAQRTWIVDAANGAGADFTDLPPAVAAAADGDVVLVRPGAYSAFDIVGKGLRILATSSVAPTFSVQRREGVRVLNLTPRQAVVLGGLRFFVPEDAAPFCLSVIDCAGRVHLEHVLTSQHFNTAFNVPALHINRFALVTVSASRLESHVEGLHSRLVLAGCVVQVRPTRTATELRCCGKRLPIDPKERGLRVVPTRQQRQVGHGVTAPIAGTTWHRLPEPEVVPFARPLTVATLAAEEAPGCSSRLDLPSTNWYL